MDTKIKLGKLLLDYLDGQVSSDEVDTFLTKEISNLAVDDKELEIAWGSFYHYDSDKDSPRATDSDYIDTQKRRLRNIAMKLLHNISFNQSILSS